MQAFELHGIRRAEVPDFLERHEGPVMSFRDLSNSDRLLSRLDAPLINFTTDIFALNPDWLRHEDCKHMLSSWDFYKSVGNFPGFLLVDSVSRNRNGTWAEDERLSGTLYVLSTEVPELGKERDSPSGPYVGLIYKVKISTFNNRPVFRFYAISPSDWKYWRSRYELVSMLALAEACGVSIFGRLVGTNALVSEFCTGRRFPSPDIIASLEPMFWSPPYPFLGEHSDSEDPTYLERWESYTTYLEKEGYLNDLKKAQQSRRRMFELGDEDAQ